MYKLFIVLVIVGIAIYKLRKKENLIFEASFSEPNEVANSRNAGFSIGSSKLFISSHLSYNNVFICGRSGSGKGACYITNSIYNILAKSNASIICVDPGGQNWQLTSGAAAQTREVKEIDFTKRDSWGYCGLQNCNTDTEINQLVHVLHTNSDANSSEGFFVSSSENFVAFGCKVIKTLEPQYHTFTNVLRFIDSFATNPETSTDELVVRTNNEELIRQYKAFSKVPENTMQSIIAQARATLRLFYNDAIVATTSVAQSIDISSLRKTPQVLYLTTSIPQIPSVRPVIAMTIQAVYDKFLETLPSEDDLDVYILLDEASSYRISNFSVYMSNARRYRIPTMIALQEKNSLEFLYKGQAKNIVNNCTTQCYIGGTEGSTLRDLSQILGDHTRVDKETNKRSRQPLLSVAEINRLEDTALTIVGAKSMLVKLHPYYKDRNFTKLSQLEPFKSQTNFGNLETPLYKI